MSTYTYTISLLPDAFDHELLISCLLDAGDVAGASEAHDVRVRAMAELDIEVEPFNER